MSKAFCARLLTASIAVSMLAAPTFAAARTVPSAAIDPMIALSLLGSTASRNAVCGIAVAGAAGAASAASAAAAQPVGPAQGCVLPINEPAVVAVETPPTPTPVAYAAPSSGFSLGLPILLAAAGAAVLAALTLFGKSDEDRSPVSPS